MTASAIGSSPPAHTHRHHHTSPAQQNPLDPAASGTGASTTAASTAPSGDGLRKFASELQSILLQAQSGQPSTTGTTATNPSTATDPAGASDPTAPAGGGPIRHIAERLQSLLNDGSQPSATTSQASGSDSLQSVLDTLQKTLQQRLQSYATATPATATTALTA